MPNGQCKVHGGKSSEAMTMSDDLDPAGAD
jgi:hypothetical protein